MSPITRNLTSAFVRLRTEHKRKKNRFASLSLLNGSHDELAGDGLRQTDRATPVSATRRQHLLPSAHDITPPSLRPTGVVDHVHIEMSSAASHRRPSLPPIWVDVVEETQDTVGRIKERMSALQKAQQRRLLKVFGDDSRFRLPDREIEKLSENITQLFRQAEASVRQIRDSTSTAHNGAVVPPSHSEVKLRVNAQSSLATQLQALSVQFRKQQKYFAAELRKRWQPEVDSPSDLLGLGDEPKQQMRKMAEDFTEAQVAELEQMEGDVDSRNEEIAHISRNVAEMHTIFKELAILVIDQGTVLDRIDYNVEQVVEQTRDANVHLKKAEDYQRSGRATRVIIFLVVAIIVLILLFIWKHV